MADKSQAAAPPNATTSPSEQSEPTAAELARACSDVIAIVQHFPRASAVRVLRGVEAVLGLPSSQQQQQAQRSQASATRQQAPNGNGAGNGRRS